MKQSQRGNFNFNFALGFFINQVCQQLFVEGYAWKIRNLANRTLPKAFLTVYLESNLYIRPNPDGRINRKLDSQT